MNERRKLILSIIIFMTIMSIIFLKFIWVSSVINSLMIIEIGRYTGPIIAQILIILFLIGILIIPYKILSNYDKKLTKDDFFRKLKSNRRKIFGLALISFSIAILFISAFSLIFVSRVVPYSDRISLFVAQNRNETLTDYVANLTDFLNINLQSSYNKPESLFEVDEEVCLFFFDGGLLNIAGINRADVILYQGWGSCGQASILLEQVMHDSGYETRQARFIGIDHGWVELKNNTQWLIVDPWYIGNLINIETLRNAKDGAFFNATGVEVKYYNGTICDANQEYGY